MVLSHICTWQYNIRLPYRIKWTQKHTCTAHYILFCANILFGDHLWCHIYFLEIILGVWFMRQLQMYVLQPNVAKRNKYSKPRHSKTSDNIYLTTILDAISIISKCSVMPRWHHSDSWRARYWLQESVKKKSWTLFPGPDKIPHESAGLRYMLTKLQLMSVPVFCCVSARYYRFDGKQNMVTHLIIKIWRIYFKICIKPLPVQTMVFKDLCVVTVYTCLKIFKTV